jgi:predicted RND superfamily exporter protein
MEAFLSNQFRVQGEWIAQNALAVLAVALIIAVVLCLGLFLLTVETRPEKVGLWVVRMLQVLKLSKTLDDPLQLPKYTCNIREGQL